MVILCVSGGTIFNVVYVFEVYYLPLQQAMELSKSQVGMLLGVFGAFSMLSYGPGGWLADRFSSRKLITIAMLFTGGTGFLYAGFPGYKVALALHALWGICISLVFWNAMIKATRNWAPSLMAVLFLSTTLCVASKMVSDPLSIMPSNLTVSLASSSNMSPLLKVYIKSMMLAQLVSQA